MLSRIFLFALQHCSPDKCCCVISNFIAFSPSEEKFISYSRERDCKVLCQNFIRSLSHNFMVDEAHGNHVIGHLMFFPVHSSKVKQDVASGDSGTGNAWGGYSIFWYDGIFLLSFWTSFLTPPHSPSLMDCHHLICKIIFSICFSF